MSRKFLESVQEVSRKCLGNVEEVAALANSVHTISRADEDQNRCRNALQVRLVKKEQC